ncbi:CRISPR-associated protein DevS [Cyanobacterium stanieri PCC 7202]|uniref:CRISPR-associated protein DevS n=1 Tax=Cyanobacterium stanieri (strain ATCC 29140 / PCC 7202) TaxID=292563 RepID=K9YPD2_CYASC|nr:CRISPR-associated protein DevS [Cyanobacterium stanieri PCC 7202]
MIFLYFKAPFASFRPFQSGSYRSTTPIPSPSTVYGILLNLAGIELRDDINKPISNNCQDLPSLKVAIALLSGKSDKIVLSQQLHNYPVGNSGKELAKKTYGNKYWISPVRREVLINHEFIVGIKGNSDIETKIIKGLNGELEKSRYGLPFAGDNNFLFDSIEIIEQPQLARWFFPIQDHTRAHHQICRLTTWIDREDNTKTKIKVFAPTDFTTQPPEKVWITLPQ